MPAIFIKTWKTLEGSEALNRLLKVLIVAINAQCYSVDAHPWFGGGDHLCPYGRKLIGSLVPVHSRSVRSNIYAFLDPSLKIFAFLLNYFTCFPIHNMIVLTGSWEPGPESRKAYVLDRTLLPLTGTKEPISFLPYGHK